MKECVVLFVKICRSQFVQILFPCIQERPLVPLTCPEIRWKFYHMSFACKGNFVYSSNLYLPWRLLETHDKLPPYFRTREWYQRSLLNTGKQNLHELASTNFDEKYNTFFESSAPKLVLNNFSMYHNCHLICLKTCSTLLKEIVSWTLVTHMRSQPKLTGSVGLCVWL